MGKLETLKKMLEESHYTVALCGSGMMEEGGFVGIKIQERAYEIEKRYGASPEELFSSRYYNTRPEKFFQFYKREIVGEPPEVTESFKTMAAMEREGKLQCIITANIYERGQKAGCKNVINLHGSIYQNKCQRCGREYSLEYMKNAPGVPICETCSSVVRPGVSLFGEMSDARLVTKTTEEVERAEVLLILGTTLQSEVFANYIRCFHGKNMVVIHKEPHFLDYKADLVIIDEPKNVFPKLGYE